jgi:anti-sigma regulatory factor (Ser/Thr protein kinase)
MSLPILTVAIAHEQDIVIARRRARQIAELLRFPPQDAVRISTAVSEIARNAFTYGGGGKAEFLVEKEFPSFVIRISDHGPGIADVESILSGRYRSATGMGMGIVGVTGGLLNHFSTSNA